MLPTLRDGASLRSPREASVALTVSACLLRKKYHPPNPANMRSAARTRTYDKVFLVGRIIIYSDRAGKGLNPVNMSLPLPNETLHARDALMARLDAWVSESAICARPFELAELTVSSLLFNSSDGIFFPLTLHE